MASSYLETVRCPVVRARNHVAFADANLTGLVARLKAGDLTDRSTIRQAIAKCQHARQDLDRAIYAAIEVETLNGRRLAANDPDDMADALLARLEINEQAGRAASYNTGYPEAHSPWG